MCENTPSRSQQDAGDDELMGYLLQLVQALRYESEDDSQLAVPW